MTWTTVSRPWHDTSVDYCEVCGNLLIGRAWTFVDDRGVTIRACRPDDERLWRLLQRTRAARATQSETAT
jgi:hypothetical protein